MSARRSQHLFELLTLGLLALPTWVGGQAIPDELLTRAERSALRETGSYDDVMALSVLATAKARVYLQGNIHAGGERSDP